MNNEIDFALVSQVHNSARVKCSKCPRGGRYFLCNYPDAPACKAACAHDPEECDVDAWEKAHPVVAVPNGRTNIGPVHYFRDCKGLKPRQQGHGRVVGLDAGTIEALGLPVCERCTERMAPLERQMQVVSR